MTKVLNKPLLLIIYLMLIAAIFATAISIIRQRDGYNFVSFDITGMNIDQFVNISECFRVEVSKQAACMDNFVAAYAQRFQKDTKAMLADEEVARSQNTDIENSCHPVVHAVGRYTYRVTGNVGDAFNACDQSCHSGCYHGVMERLFYSEQDSAEGLQHISYADLEKKIPGICDADKFSNPSSQLIFQCLHGVGHAILYSLQYDLRRSLNACDLFETEYQRSSCYGGVVMENITAFDKAKRDIDPNDPLYPCDQLDSQYRDQCYLMQTSIMFEFGMTVERIADTCRGAGANVEQCFVSLGRDLSNYVRTGDVQRVVAACEITSGDQAESCYQGTLYALIDNTWDGRYGYLYCDALDAESEQLVCYGIANNYFTWAYNKTKTEIAEECTKFSAHAAVCQSAIY